nr:WYL domain-containing protein [Cupriavidus sp. amp6]
MSADTLAVLLRAIRGGYALRVTYQSMTRPEPTERVLSPHALAHNGFRWHVRAFCHSRGQFRDFVIARILSIGDIEPTVTSQSDDKEWQTIIKLVLAPNPGLSGAHQRVIELDYGMENGEVILVCRQALLFYLLRNLGLDERREKRPQAQQIVLRNADEVARYLSESAEPLAPS